MPKWQPIITRALWVSLCRLCASTWFQIRVRQGASRQAGLSPLAPPPPPPGDRRPPGRFVKSANRTSHTPTPLSPAPLGVVLRGACTASCYCPWTVATRPFAAWIDRGYSFPCGGSGLAGAAQFDGQQAGRLPATRPTCAAPPLEVWILETINTRIAAQGSVKSRTARLCSKAPRVAAAGRCATGRPSPLDNPRTRCRPCSGSIHTGMWHPQQPRQGGDSRNTMITHVARREGLQDPLLATTTIGRQYESVGNARQPCRPRRVG